MPEILVRQHVILDSKVAQGAVALPGGGGERITEGLGRQAAVLVKTNPRQPG